MQNLKTFMLNMAKSSLEKHIFNMKAQVNETN